MSAERAVAPAAQAPSATGSTAPYQQTSEAVIASLGTNAERGLAAQEAGERLTRDGANELQAEAPVPAWRRFAQQFSGVLVILLLLAAAISAGLWLVERESALPYEALAIMSVVLLNAIIGYVQESRAASAVAALRKMSAAQASVIRDGERRGIPASELVCGDIVVLEEGDTIPADARLIQSSSLQTAEAALTGESFPVVKDIGPISGDADLGDRLNMVYSGTTVTSGRGSAVVTQTAMATEMGRIAGLLKNTSEDPTPLQRELDRVGRLLGIVVVVIAVIMIGTIILLSGVRTLSGMFDVLILGVAMAVAAVPEGLPAVVTAVLALGVQRMATRRAIVRHLAAVETLGSATVIASDKTGTLTRNEMTVRRIVTASGRVHVGGTGYEPVGTLETDGGGPVEGDVQRELLRALTAADRVNNATIREQDGRWLVQGDPTEGALIVAARKAGLQPADLEAHFPRVAEIPFSAERKLMTTVHRGDGAASEFSAFIKGAPDVLLALCSHELTGESVVALSDARRTEIGQANDALAGEALRTIGVAARMIPASPSPGEYRSEDLEHDLTFLGLIGMIDPPRDEAKDAVARARAAGIRPIMITGDHPRTAAVIARELGISLDGRVLAGADLAALSDETLTESVRDISVFARVSPEHKLRIVKALQRRGEIVAMTGDGVNDAPALKAADIGIAMGITGTDVVKEVADVVLMDDNFATIVTAVEEGRAIFSNIRKFLRFLLSSNIGEVMTMFVGVLFADFLGLRTDGDTLVLPLLATQLLWINIVTDGLPALALGIDPAESGLMSRPPRPRAEGVLTRRMWGGIAFVGGIMAVGTLLVLDAGLPGGFIDGSGTMRHAQTMAFTTLVLFQLFNVFNARSDETSAFHQLFRNKWLWSALTVSVSLQIAVINVPFLQVAFSTQALTFGDWMQCTVVASCVLWFRDASKYVGRLFNSN
ncbi:MAG: cation-translocating P-type ATPase [Gemmatimonadaceae bacterium]|nr:cation-translocating P-type ATPase [Gemmatimonadaceae bacterium]